MSEIRDWAVVSDENRLAPPNGFPLSPEFNEITRSSREMMGAIARYNQALGAIATTGADGAYVLTLSITIPALALGDRFIFQANHNSIDGTNTLAVNGLTAVDLVVPQGGPVGLNQLAAGAIYEAVFDGTSFRIIGGLGSVASVTDLGLIPSLEAFLLSSTLVAARAALGVIPVGSALLAIQVAGAPGAQTIFRPAGTQKVFYILIGGGGGAGGQETTNGWGGGGGQAGGLAFGVAPLTSGSSTCVVGAAGSNGANDATTPVAGTDGGDSTYEGTTAGGGDGGDPGTASAGGGGGTLEGLVTLAPTHVGGALSGDPGQTGGQFDFVTGTSGGLRQALAAGHGGAGSFNARGRGGGGAAGAVKEIPANGFGLFMFFG